MSFCTSCGDGFQLSDDLFCKSCGDKRPGSLSQQNSEKSQQMSPSLQEQNIFHPDSSPALPDETFNKIVAIRVAILQGLILVLFTFALLPIFIFRSNLDRDIGDVISLTFLFLIPAAFILLTITSLRGLANGNSFLRKTKYLRISKDIQFSDLANLEIKGYKLGYSNAEEIVFTPSIYYQILAWGLVYGSTVNITIKKQGDEGIISYYGVDDASNFLSFRPAVFKVIYGRLTDALAKVTDFTVLSTTLDHSTSFD